MQWHCLVTALACASLHVHSTPCTWEHVKNAWSTGFMAVVNIQMEETVDHWSVGIEFSQSVDSFESWKGLVTETSDKNFTIRNHCYNNIIYSCQCFQLAYVARHQLHWERNTTVRFNGQLTSSCFQDPCIDIGVSTPTPTSSTGISPQDAIVRVIATVQAISEGLQNMSNNRYKRNVNFFTEDENKLLERLTNLTIYLNNECTNESGKCESKNIERFQRELESSFKNIKETKTISPGFQQTFEESKKTFDEIASAAKEEQRKPATPTMITARTTTPSTIPLSKICPLKSELVARKQTSLLNKFIQKRKAEETGFEACVDKWCLQDDTNQQYTRCEEARDGGNTCVHPEIKYGTTEGGIPNNHPINNYDAWCKQIFSEERIGSITSGKRDCAAPKGLLFWRSGYDENRPHWCDLYDGFWKDTTLEYSGEHAGYGQYCSNTITTVTCKKR